MHVLVIAQLFPPDMGGGATRAYNTSKGLVKNGCKVTVITAFPHYPYGKIPKNYRWKPLVVEYKNGMKINRTFVPPLSSKGTMNRILLFASFILSSLFVLPFVRKIDIIWAANPNVLVVYPALLFRLMKRCPIVQNIDDLWPEDFCALGLTEKESLIFKIVSLLARVSYRNSDAITPISPGYVNVLSEKYKIPKRKIRVVRSGVDLEIFTKREAEDLIDNKFKVFYTGAFSVAYDFDQILNAAKELESHEDIEFVIQGGGELAGYIRKQINRIGLKNVKLIEKIKSRSEISNLLHNANVLLLPLRDFKKPYLGISSKLYEYQAVEKPIICCSEGQPAQYIIQTNSGIVVKPGSHKALVRAVLYFHENKDVAEKTALSGRKYVEKNLSIEKIGQRMKLFFEEIISRGHLIT